jgi:hypothetical protein
MGQTQFSHTLTARHGDLNGPKSVINLANRNQGTGNSIERNWAFIDMQNAYKSALEKGWKIKWDRFRQYLKDQYNVTRAIAFMGYLKEYKYLYKHLRCVGFHLEFSEAWRMPDGKILGGNIDPDLTSYCMDLKTSYHKAIIVADDRGYTRTIKSLRKQNKLKMVLSPHPIETTSTVVRRAVEPRFIASIQDIRDYVS